MLWGYRVIGKIKEKGEGIIIGKFKREKTDVSQELL